MKTKLQPVFVGGGSEGFWILETPLGDFLLERRLANGKGSYRAGMWYINPGTPSKQREDLLKEHSLYTPFATRRNAREALEAALQEHWQTSQTRDSPP